MALVVVIQFLMAHTSVEISSPSMQVMEILYKY